MDPSGKEKTTFVTGQGTYYYRVMPFWLKNARATYQRLVSKMFQKLIGAPMKVLAESFQTLKNYNMKLNPTKCTFGVSAGKFFGFIVNNRGIEGNPDKIKVVLDMQPPLNTKEIQRLTGRVAALSRFVSRSNDKC